MHFGVDILFRGWIILCVGALILFWIGGRNGKP